MEEEAYRGREYKEVKRKRRVEVSREKETI